MKNKLCKNTGFSLLVLEALWHAYWLTSYWFSGNKYVGWISKFKTLQVDNMHKMLKLGVWGNAPQEHFDN